MRLRRQDAPFAELVERQLALFEEDESELLAEAHEAEEEFRKVLELSPADDYAQYALGRALRNQGRHDEARGHLKLARSLRPRSPGEPALEHGQGSRSATTEE